MITKQKNKKIKNENTFKMKFRTYLIGQGSCTMCPSMHFLSSLYLWLQISMATTPTLGISRKCAFSQILCFEGTYFVDPALCKILGTGTGWGLKTHQNHPWSRFLPPQGQWHPSKLKKIQSKQLAIKWSVFVWEVNHIKGLAQVFVANRLGIQRTNSVIGFGK